MNKKNKKNNKGFSLLELVLAIAIFSLSSVALVTLIIDAGVSTRLSQERSEALFYAKEGMDAVRAIRDSAWASTTVGTHGLSTDNSSWVFAGDSDLINDKYTRTVEIEDVSVTTKNVTVNIVWSLTPARPATVTLTTILTNWRNN
jgi:prepilin-type N-terminal cleavage/methylation domain-containing protein